MRDLPPDPSIHRRRRARRRMDRSMFALVLSALLLGIALIVYFVLTPPLPAPTTLAGGSTTRERGAKQQFINGPHRVPLSAEAEEAADETASDAALAESVETGEPAAAHGTTKEFVGSSLRPARVRIDRIVATLVPSPRYELIKGPDKPFRPRTWLQVEVEFTTFTSVIDELTLRYFITLRGHTFGGDIEHASLTAGAHVSVAYLVSARTERFLVDGKFPKHAFRCVFIEAREHGELAGLGFIGEALSPPAHPIEGFVRNIDQTPFAPLAGDRYEPVAPPAPAEPVRVPPRARRLTQTSSGTR